MPRINLLKINVTSLGTLGFRVIEIVEGSGLKEIVESKALAALKEFAPVYKQGILKNYASKLTAKVVEKDAERDRLVNGFIMGIEQNLDSPLDALREAAASGSTQVARRNP